MDFPQFLRLFYTSFSPKADCESAKNLYLERVESGNGRSPLVMLRSPGLKIFSGDVPVILTSCPIRGVQVGVAFSKFLLASGGTPPYTWAITSGSLPNGITLNATTGELSGTATEAGTFPFTVSITDADHIVGSKSCFVISSTIGITSGCPVAEAALGVPYTFPFTTDGVGPFQWLITSGSLPNGITLDAATGELAGTATETGTFPFVVQVTDSNGLVASTACAVIVTGTPIASLRIPLEMCSEVPIETDIVATTFSCVGMPIDSADYPEAVAAWWQVSCHSNTATETPRINGVTEYNLDLVDDLGNVKATVTVPANTPYVTTMPLVQFTLTSGQRTYSLRTRGEDYGCRVDRMTIYVDVVNPTRAKFQVMLTTLATFNPTPTETGDPASNNQAAFMCQVNNAADIYSNSALLPPTWLKESSKWGTVETWELEVMARMNESGLTAHAALRRSDEFAGTVIAASDITINGTVITRYSATLADDAPDFTDDEYRLQYKFSNGDSNKKLQIYRAALYVTLTGSALAPMKGQLYHKILTGAQERRDPPDDADLIGSGERFLYETANYPPGTVWYNEGTQRYLHPNPNLNLLSVFDAALATEGPAGSLVAGSTLDFTGTTHLTRKRSGALTLVDGHYHAGHITDSTAAQFQRISYGQFLIGEFALEEANYLP